MVNLNYELSKTCKNLYIFLYVTLISMSANSQVPFDLCNCASMIYTKYFKVSHYNQMVGHTSFGRRNGRRRSTNPV